MSAQKSDQNRKSARAWTLSHEKLSEALKVRIAPSARTRFLLAIALGAFGLAVAAAWKIQERRKTVEVSVSTGGAAGLHHRLVQSLATNAGAHGLRIRSVVMPEVDKAIGALEARTLDFATILGGFDLAHHHDLRQVAALHIEPLHLVVKEEIYDDVARSLTALKGKVVLLGGSPTSVGHELAREILTFSGLKVATATTPGDFVISEPGFKVINEHRRDHLPDAVFLISAIPSTAVKHLIVEHRFRLVPLPFAKAFGLGALADAAEHPVPTESGESLLKERIAETIIPAFTYQVDPPVPGTDLPTLGARLLILTHRDTDPVVVERLLEAIYTSRFARVFVPHLVPSVSEGVQELHWHPGAVSFLSRDDPVVTGTLISNLANTIQIAAPALTTLFFLWQWFRQRTRMRREDHFESYILKILRIESDATELPPSRRSIPALLKLQGKLARLKSEALGLFCKGELRGAEHMASFLMQVNDARLHISNLIQQARHDGDLADAAIEDAAAVDTIDTPVS